MNTGIMALFDVYGRKARLYPAFLVMLPAVLSFYIWFPEQLGTAKIFWGIILSSGCLLLLAHIGRERGKKVEKTLIASWGGLPTTIMLRREDTFLDPITKKRYYDYLEKNIQGLRFQENEDNTDPWLESAVRWLREHTRDRTRYPLVFSENVNYGFARNTLGLKPYGILICLITILANCLGIYFKFGGSLTQVPIDILAVTILNIIILSIWFRFVTDTWVRSVGDAYARSLLSACESSLNNIQESPSYEM